MHAVRSLLRLVPVVLLAACQRGPAPDAPQARPADAATPYGVQSWTLPTRPGAAQPDLVATANGELLLSWLSSIEGRRTALQFARFDGRHWESEARTVAVGNRFVVNWADTPHIAATADGALWIQWLQKTEGGRYAYDTMLSRSRDGGFNWSAPVAVNTDGLPTEHGFVSMWPASRDRLGIAWLDGRDAAAAGAAHDAQADATATEDAGEHGATMTLRAAVFDGELARSGEVELDGATCDCCQTAAALTARGPLVVYRDRTAEEIRDIAAVRFEKGAWTRPRVVHADAWRMPACPVNGPAVAARGDDVVVAWYTAAQDRPSVKLARSDDAGDRFAAPVTVDAGDAVQGRVAVALDARQAWVLWVREDAAGQSLWLARYAPDLSRELQRVEVAKLQGRGRGTGFPQLALRADGAWLVWTDVVAGVSQLRGAHVAAAAR